MTLDEIVADYILEYREGARAEMQFYEQQRSPSEAIRNAALCILPDGKRHPHQRRTPKEVLENVEISLQKATKRLRNAQDFTAVYQIVESEIGGIRGVGPLTIYDIAQRLGAYFRKKPQLVYLHSGTKEGAAIFGVKGDLVHPNKLPVGFSRLTPSEIEDCLCIYRDQLRTNVNSSKRNIQACRHHRCKLTKHNRGNVCRLVFKGAGAHSSLILN